MLFPFAVLLKLYANVDRVLNSADWSKTIDISIRVAG
jgi:hypothetical protein